MSAGQESGSPIRENRTLLPAPLPPDEARGTLAAAAGVSTVGLRPPFDTPQRHSHPVCRAILTLIVALERAARCEVGRKMVELETNRLLIREVLASDTDDFLRYRQE